jgi:cell division protein FtsA
MSTRIGFANEHLAKDTPDEISHPSYATSVGLILRGLKSNNFEDIKDDETSSTRTKKITFFENWSKKFLNYLLNE